MKRLLLIPFLIINLPAIGQIQNDSVIVDLGGGTYIRYVHPFVYLPGDPSDSLIGRNTATKKRMLVSKFDLPISNLTQAAINLKANIASPAFTGTPTGIGFPVYARVTGSNATTTGQALVDIAGLSISLTTNAVYQIEAILMVASSSTAGNQYAVNYSVAGATVEAQISGTLGAATARSDRINALNTATPAYVAVASNGAVRIEGIVTTGANAGNLTVKHLKTTSGTSTVFINSYLKVTRVL